MSTGVGGFPVSWRVLFFLKLKLADCDMDSATEPDEGRRYLERVVDGMRPAWKFI